MEKEKNEPIVIASTDCERSLYVIAKAGMNSDRIEINYVDRYAPTVEYLLRLLRKAFGWLEYDRTTKEVQNTKCRHNVNGVCCHPEKIKVTPNINCKESVRMSCADYIQKSDNKFVVNVVIIEKAGGIRGMD